MNQSLLVGALLGGMVTTGGGASLYYLAQEKPLAALAAGEPTAVEQAATVAQEAEPTVSIPSEPVTATPAPGLDAGPVMARVVGVRPIEETVSIPREQCVDETVTHTEPVKDSEQITGTIGGAVLGGILGHQVGDGRGKDLATIAGAAAGAFGGRKAQQQIQKSRTWTTTERRCETVFDNRTEIKGYEVRYESDGKSAITLMDYLPGDEIALNELGL